MTQLKNNQHIFLTITLVLIAMHFPKSLKWLEDVLQPGTFFSKQLLTSSQHHDVMSHVSYFLGYQTSVIYPWTACSVVLHLWTFGLQLSTNKIYRPCYRGGILSRKVLFFQVSNERTKNIRILESWSSKQAWMNPKFLPT